MSGLGIW